jgi:hypothetical protein
MFHVRAALFTLAALSGSAWAADTLMLAPGKSVTVVDGNDPSIRVLITAPADRALDLLIGSQDRSRMPPILGNIVTVPNFPLPPPARHR